jgi:hypothetical protein
MRYNIVRECPSMLWNVLPFRRGGNAGVPECERVQARELLEAMCTSRYADAFRILDELRPVLAMDPYLPSHLARLTQQIRCRALQQYVKPFHSLRLADMAEALGGSAEDLEVELARLITEGAITARIDSHNKARIRPLLDFSLRHFK